VARSSVLLEKHFFGYWMTSKLRTQEVLQHVNVTWSSHSYSPFCLIFKEVRTDNSCKICRTLASDSLSDTEWRHTEQCGLLSMASLTTAIFSGARTVFTLPPFFFSVEPVALKFRTHGLMEQHHCDES
jgi:hypothetical protein